MDGLFGCCNVRKTTGLPDAPPSVMQPDDKQESKISMPRQSLAGVGIVFLGVPGEGLVVQAFDKGGPAEMSQKVQKGDILQTINGDLVKNMTDQQLAKNLLGPPGSKVQLGLERKGPAGETFQVDITRGWPKSDA
mmetsp:Transcript_54966/g.112252  ORF Transcript_54966/g.112252 Transcript_54966/m.112252 type:complete len:135 (-) Transcript_54966:232-636(-)